MLRISFNGKYFTIGQNISRENNKCCYFTSYGGSPSYVHKVWGVTSCELRVCVILIFPTDTIGHSWLTYTISSLNDVTENAMINMKEEFLTGRSCQSWLRLKSATVADANFIRLLYSLEVNVIVQKFHKMIINFTKCMRK